MNQPAKPRVRVNPEQASGADTGTAETPTQAMVSGSLKLIEVTDENGRVLKVKKISALERMRLFAMAGAELSRNEMWIGNAALAVSCAAIDGDPVVRPVSRAQVEALVERLDDEGIRAISQAYVKHFGVAQPEDIEDAAEAIKN